MFYFSIQLKPMGFMKQKRKAERWSTLQSRRENQGKIMWDKAAMKHKKNSKEHKLR